MKNNRFLICFLILGAIVISLVLLASVPPVSRDALTHHLIVPKLFIEHGGIFEIPYIVFSYYPMNLQLLYMIPLYFGNDIIPKYIHMVFAVLTAFLIYRYLKEKIDQNWAICGAIFFLTIPVIIKLSITVYVDLGLVFFSTASIMQILKWRRTDFCISSLLYAGFFCGLALGCKYNGLITFCILTILIIFLYLKSMPSSREHQIKALKYGFIFAVISLITFSPWLVKNYIWTGNPVYPLYNDILNFKPGLVEAKEHVAAITHNVDGWSSFLTRKMIYGETWWEILLVPIRIFFQGQDSSPRYFDGILNPFLFILPLFTVFPKRGKKIKVVSDQSFFLFFSIFFILIVFFTTEMRMRWIGPVIPPLVCLSVIGIKRIYDFSDKVKYLKLGFALLCVMILGFNINYLISQFKIVRPFEYLSGDISRVEYIKRYRPEISTIEFANANLGKNSTLFSLFIGNRRYYSNHKMVFDYAFFESAVKKSKNEKVFTKLFLEKGYSHVIINYSLFNNWVYRRFTDIEKEIIAKFFSEERMLFAEDGYGLYEVLLE